MDYCNYQQLIYYGFVEIYRKKIPNGQFGIKLYHLKF